jgi:hypothetical protein
MNDAQLDELRALKKLIAGMDTDIIELNKKFTEVVVRMHELVESVEDGLS